MVAVPDATTYGGVIDGWNSRGRRGTCSCCLSLGTVFRCSHGNRFVFV